MHPDIPSYPFEYVVADFFSLEGKNYLALADRIFKLAFSPATRKGRLGTLDTGIQGVLHLFWHPKTNLFRRSIDIYFQGNGGI